MVGVACSLEGIRNLLIQGPRIFELKGIECDGATDIEKDEILGELLKGAEAREFKYERRMEKHPKFACLNKYLVPLQVHRRPDGDVVDETSKKMESWVNSLKKGNQLSLEFLGKNASSSAGSTDGVNKVSESFKTLSEKLKELSGLRAKLRTNSEELMLIQASIKAIKKMDDQSWSKKLDEVGTAVQGRPGEQDHRSMRHPSKGSGQIIKQTKQLLGAD